MQINVNMRLAAARILLDGVSTMDVDGDGDVVEETTLRALTPLAVDLADPQTAAALAAATDLIWFLTLKMSQNDGVGREELISNMRQYVLPAMYPDATA